MVENILSEIYPDIDTPLRVLRKYDLEKVLDNSIKEITNHLGKSPTNFSAFREIASTILVSVNTVLRKIDDPIEKAYLEVLLRDIAVHLLTRTRSNVSNPERFVSEVTASLQTVSSIHGYNFESLIALLRLNKSKYLKQELSNPRDQYYYDWIGSGNDLDELARTLYSEGWILSVKEFKKLFTNHRADNLCIKFSRKYLIELIILFDLLKAKGLVKPKGGKGHFHPLKIHLVDLEKNVLFTREPKIVKTIAKRNPAKWNEMAQSIEKWLSGFKIRVTLKLP